jgi:hypothetical protein
VADEDVEEPGWRPAVRVEEARQRRCDLGQPGVTGSTGATGCIAPDEPGTGSLDDCGERIGIGGPIVDDEYLEANEQGKQLTDLARAISDRNDHGDGA